MEKGNGLINQGIELWRWMRVGGVDTDQFIEELIVFPDYDGNDGDYREGYFTPHTAEYLYGDIVVWHTKPRPAKNWEYDVQIHPTNGMKIVTTLTTMPTTTSETTTITIPHYALCYIIRIAFDSGETFTENTPDEFLTAVNTLSTNVNTLSTNVNTLSSNVDTSSTTVNALSSTVNASSSSVTALDNNTFKRNDPSFNLRKDIDFHMGTTDSGRHLFKIRAYNNGATMIRFENGGNVKGSVTCSSSSTSYNTASDYRLKTVISPIADAPMRLLALKPIRFAWNSTGEEVDGFLAHEAQEIVPECVTGEKDAVTEDGTPEYQAIDQSKIVPLLVASLQDALKRIAVLENSG